MAVNNRFASGPDTDITGSTNGSYVVTYSYQNGLLSIYDMSGKLVQSTSHEVFWCAPASALPICSAGGDAVDPRLKYDTGSRRWILTALWLWGRNNVATDVLAVSRQSDPTKGWYLYQFPACGAFDTWDHSDQPHTGFNNQWIVVTSDCSAHNGVNGAGLAVFDKQNLYIGGKLVLNGKWFEFVDPYSGGPFTFGGVEGTRDDPAMTYVQAINNREYLTASLINQGKAAVIYSYVEGKTDSPSFHAGTETVTTSFSAGWPVSVNAPGCTACINAYVNGWIHSSNLWRLQNGDAYILSTMVLSDPSWSNSTQIISIATNTRTGAATALRLTDGAGDSGPLAAEIAMQLQGGSLDEALIAYDDSRGNFYPGIKAALWEIETNTVSHIEMVVEGSFTPRHGDQDRWADYIDAIAPVPGSSSFIVGGTLAAPSSTFDPERVTYWATVTP
jgi:hypothetical protein